MTDRVNALTVILDHDIRTDDIEPLIAAIKQFRSVLKVEPNIADMDSAIAEARARSAFAGKLYELLKEPT